MKGRSERTERTAKRLRSRKGMVGKAMTNNMAETIGDPLGDDDGGAVAARNAGEAISDAAEAVHDRGIPLEAQHVEIGGRVFDHAYVVSIRGDPNLLVYHVAGHCLVPRHRRQPLHHVGLFDNEALLRWLQPFVGQHALIGLANLLSVGRRCDRHVAHEHHDQENRHQYPRHHRPPFLRRHQLSRKVIGQRRKQRISKSCCSNVCPWQE